MPIAHETVLAACTLLPQQDLQFLVSGLYSLRTQYRLTTILGALMRNLERRMVHAPMLGPELRWSDYLAHGGRISDDCRNGYCFLRCCSRYSMYRRCAPHYRTLPLAWRCAQCYQCRQQGPQ